MTKKIFILLVLLILAGYSAKAQLYSFGVKAGMGLSRYCLSNEYVFYNTTGNSPTYHAGIFGRRNISKFFIQGELNMLAGMKARISFRRSEYEFSKSSISLPILVGRNFYPGNFRIYAGLCPTFFLGSDEISDYLEGQGLLAVGSNGSSQGINYTTGTGIDFNNFTVDISYLGNLLGGFFYEDKNPNIRTYHSFSVFLVSLGYKFH